MKYLQVEQASKYKDHGFKNLHVVDLDGALTGETINLDVIQEIVISNLILKLKLEAVSEILIVLKNIVMLVLKKLF